MPLYPYRCTACGHQFEKIQSFSAEPLTECPKCKGKVERVLTAPSLSFKGAGWYVNDYSKGASAPAPKAECGGGASPACASCPAAAATTTSN